MKPLDGCAGYAHQRRMADDHHQELNEISAILAAALLRVLERKSSRNLIREAKTPLDCRRKCGGDVRQRTEDVAP